MMNKAPVESGATAMAEAALLRALILTLDLKDIVLLAVGSSNPICYRLVHMVQELERVIFVNPIFNQDIMQVFHPAWFREMLKQIISSRSGLRVAEAGMKLMIKNDLGIWLMSMRTHAITNMQDCSPWKLNRACSTTTPSCA